MGFKKTSLGFPKDECVVLQPARKALKSVSFPNTKFTPISAHNLCIFSFLLLPSFLASFRFPVKVKLSQNQTKDRKTTSKWCDKYVRRPGWPGGGSASSADERAALINSPKETRVDWKVATLRAGVTQFCCWLLISLENSSRLCSN